MKRRAVLLGLASVAAPTAGRAASHPLSMTNQGPLYRAYVQRPQIIRQGCAEWCWAASSAMIFAMHGHGIDQARIVESVFGQANVCRTVPGIVMAQIMSRQWEDDDGATFQAQVSAAYDFGAGVNAIDEAFIVNELRSDRPLLYGNGHHAMVLSQVDYLDTPFGPRIQAAGVFDPFPTQQPFHLLSPMELRPKHLGGQLDFLAAVSVS